MNAIERVIKNESENYPTHWNLVMGKKSFIGINHREYGVKKETLAKQARKLGFKAEHIGYDGVILSLV